MTGRQGTVHAKLVLREVKTWAKTVLQLSPAPSQVCLRLTSCPSPPRTAGCLPHWHPWCLPHWHPRSLS